MLGFHFDQCPDCQSIIFELDEEIVRYQQVAQLSDQLIEVVEHQQICCKCQQCGVIVEAGLPEDVVPGQDLGVSVQAMLRWLGVYGHLIDEKQQEWRWEMGKIEVEIVTLCATTKRLAEAVLPQVRRLGDWVKHYEHMQVDESPWLVRGVKEWMWVFTGEGVCLFLHAGDTRSRSELEAVLGPPSKGVLSSDDLSLYNGYDAKAQQKCLARLLQYFKRVAKLNRPTQQALAKVLIELLEQAFGVYWQWWENRECVPYELWAQAFKQFVAEALKQWWPKAGYAAGLLRNLKIKPYQWWYFLDHPEIPPDNKHSERVFRLAVTERKVLGGSRSMAGFADTVKFVTVVQTCRAQGRAVVQFFQQTLSQGISPFKCLPLINCEARSA